MTQRTSHKRVLTLTRLALLAAIEILMFFTPLGMLPLPGQYASLLTVPIAVGAMLVGIQGGTVLGFLFGFLSFTKAMQTGTLIAAGVSIPAIIMLTIPTRTLMGFLTGVLFKLIRKIDKTDWFCWFAGGLLAPVLNTVFYMTVYVIILYNAPLLQAILSAELLETLKNNVLLFLAAYVGVQAVIEAVIGCTVSGLVGKAVSKALKL